MLPSRPHTSHSLFLIHRELFGVEAHLLILGFHQFPLDSLDRADDQDTVADAVTVQPELLEDQSEREFERDVLEVMTR